MLDLHTPKQLSLLGLNEGDAEPYPSDRTDGRLADQYLMFFALLPPQPLRQTASTHGARIRRTHHLSQGLMAEDRLHVTVQPVIGLWQPIPRLLVQATVNAAQTIASACRAVDIRFDRLGSMGVRPPTVLALQADEASCRALALLRKPLLAALRRRGFAPQAHDAPHLSLVYGTDLVSSQSIEPLGWTASELVLVISHHGLGYHQHVASWPLHRS